MRTLTTTLTTTLTLALGLTLITSCGEAPKPAVAETTEKTAVQTEADIEALKKEQEAQKMAEIKANSIYATTNLAGLNGRKMKGSVDFSEYDGKVTIDVHLKGLTQGQNAIHIHEKGDCSSSDGKSAGGHWNPTGEDHGRWGKRPFHKGDIGNIKVDKNGQAKMSMTTELWCIGCGDEEKDILGKSIIIHEGIDDCTSQPSGAAGARIMCGEILVK